MNKFFILFLIFCGTAFSATSKVYDKSRNLKYVIKSSDNRARYYDKSNTLIGTAECLNGITTFRDSSNNIKYIRERDDGRCTL
jgi:cell fate (sporulation/competence/biofilm development) regulator YlbF (YheA/YmcA/DUF963 family)